MVVSDVGIWQTIYDLVMLLDFVVIQLLLDCMDRIVLLVGAVVVKIVVVTVAVVAVVIVGVAIVAVTGSSGKVPKFLQFLSKNALAFL